MNALAARRRHPAALIVVLMASLLITGALYSMFAPRTAGASVAAADYTAEQATKGKALFLANCASCHGLAATGTAAGPSLVGVGAASAWFQLSTGRMPLAGNAVQAKRNNVQFSNEDIDAMSAFVASLGPGPSRPDPAFLNTKAEGVDIANGGNIFRVNCAMCHNYAGSGGALTRGKYAPTLMGVTEEEMYTAMMTGPQSMPVFDDTNISPKQKRDVIAFLKNIDENKNPGGHNLGNLGPAGDAFFLFFLAIPLMIGIAVWLGRKAA